MRTMRWVVLAVILGAGVGVGQEVPRLTKERQQAVDELIQACAKVGAIELPDKGAVRFDEKKLRALVADRRDKLNAELVDALVAFWFAVEERREPIAVALLRACGQEKSDERALGFADFLAGKMTERQSSRWPTAIASYTAAAKHFAAVKDSTWHAAACTNQGLLHHARGEYALAERQYRLTLDIHETLYPKTRFPDGHAELAGSLNRLAVLLCDQGEYLQAEPLLHRSLKMLEALFPRANHPQGHPQLARTIQTLAGLYHFKGEFSRAEPLYDRVLEMTETLYPRSRFPQGHPVLAATLNNLAAFHQAQGENTKAESLLRRTLQMYQDLYPRSKFPDGHNDLARCLNNLASLHQDQGNIARAESLYRDALGMREILFPARNFPQGHPDIALSLNNLAALYQDQAEYAKADALFRRALAMREGLYPKASFPQGAPDIAVSINNLAVLQQLQGEYAKAEELFRRALDMRQALFPTARYPQGHPHLATSLNNLGYLHQLQGEYSRAAPLLRRTLAMYESLYPKSRFPNGHPDIALSLNNLAGLNHAQGDLTKAIALLRRSLEMREALYPKSRYPNGHLDIARSLNNLAYLHHAQGEYTKVEPLLRRNLELHEKLFPKARYPHGHPDLALSNSNLAAIYFLQGDSAQSGRLFRRAVEMYTTSAAAVAASHSEATALNYFSALPQARDGYLAVTRDATAAETYATVWQSKAALSRVIERRHLAALSSTNPKALQFWGEIGSLRRDRERLLLASMEPARFQSRNLRLDQIEEEIRAKETALVSLTPEVKRATEIANATPNDLRKSLPVGAVFVDLVRYVRVAQNPKVKGRKGETRFADYTAFVLTREAITRVDLKAAKDVEEMLSLWRRSLTEGSPSEPEYAEKMHRLVWAPLVPHLPKGTSLVYLGPDAALHGLPWAALRDPRTGHRLIEDHAVAVVPHGPMLLDRLKQKKPQQEARPGLLVMGGVEYDKAPSEGVEMALRSPVSEGVTWKALTATRKELDQIVLLAGKKNVIRREGQDAGINTLLADLPRAQTAHLATHGFFADEKFRSVFQLDEKLFASTEFLTGGTAQRFGAAARSPLVLSGLVCAGANLKDTPSRGILTAEAIVGLDLRKMDLAVLSACETGLGDVAGGEGVYGLTRAFHIAGCRNVCASLWQVEDEATAALMVLFYRQMWGKEPVPPAEALRRAQVALMREPERIKEWSAGRGPLPRPVAGGGKVFDKTPNLKVSKTRTWAGFILSGPGD